MPQLWFKRRTLKLTPYPARNCWKKINSKLYGKNPKYFRHPLTPEGYDKALAQYESDLAAHDDKQQEFAREHIEGAIFAIEAVGEMDTDGVGWDRAVGRVEGRRATTKQAKAEGRTVSTAVHNFHASKLKQAKAGIVTHSRVGTIRVHLESFVRWIGCDTLLDTITHETVQNYYDHLLGEIKSKKKPDGMSRIYARDHFATSRQMIRASLPPHQHPYNLGSPFPFKIKRRGKKPTFTVKEVRSILDNASERTQLYLLLMLNTGMQQKDISELTPEEVDWNEGRIIRKRGKTEDHDSVPEVNYKLWSRTFDLLQKFGNKTGEHVLLNEDGGQLVADGTKPNGKYWRNDNIRSAYERVCKKLEPDRTKWKQLKLLRKTSSSKMAEHKEFKFYAQHFLDQAPDNIADGHYVNPSQDEFDEAIEWLGEQFGE